MLALEDQALAACLLALSRYDGPLPAELTEQIRTVGQQLETDTHGSVEALRDLLSQHEGLEALYQNALEHLDIEEQEKAKSGVATLSTNGPVSLRQIGESILAGSNSFRENTQQLVKRPQLKRQATQVSPELGHFFDQLEQSVTRLNPTATRMLQQLDRDIFSVENLAYLLDLPLEQAQQVVQSLWNTGYIRPISDNPFKQVWLSLKGAPPLHNPPEPIIDLALTAKGYFYLHPSRLSKSGAF